MKISLGDITTYASVTTVAIIEAVNETLKVEPKMAADLPWLTSSIWHFVPLGLLVFVGLLALSKHFGWLGGIFKSTSQYLSWPDPYKPVVIRNKTFINDRVVVDGNYYLECTFENVTFHYNGTTAIKLKGNHIRGNVFFSSDNVAVKGTYLLMYGLGAIPSNTRIIGLDPATNTLAPPIKNS
jgi:hypothetical protein